jgi:hypothetical protein
MNTNEHEQMPSGIDDRKYKGRHQARINHRALLCPQWSTDDR